MVCFRARKIALLAMRKSLFHKLFRNSGGAAAGFAIALLAGLQLIAARASADEVFADVTASSGLEFEHFNGMSGELFFTEMMGSGAGLSDYDGVGDLEV